MKKPSGSFHELSNLDPRLIMNRRMLIPILVLLFSLATIGAYWVIVVGAEPDRSYGGRSDRPILVFYTSAAATFPQMPFWSALSHGRLEDLCRVEVRLWKNLDDLRGIVLAGQGDLWLGSTEVLAQARRRGAPVALLTVNGWRKFYLLSRNTAHNRMESLAGLALPYAPVGSPGAALLKALTSHGFPALDLVPYEPRQLELALLSGRYDAALVAEPQATILMARDPGLKVISGVEDIYSRLTGGPARLPLACLAINSRTARIHPALVARLMEILVDEGRLIKADPQRGLEALPQEFEAYIPRDMIRRSLARDMILVEPAFAVRQEITAFLKIMDLEVYGAPDPPALAPDFIWR